MSDMPSCERFEERLAEYMENEVRGTERATLDAHAATCAACAELVADLRAIAARAAMLGPIDPPASVWAGVESRIAADVVSIGSVAPRGARARRVVPLSYGIAAALAMMTAASGITWVAMKQEAQDLPSAASMVASQEGAAPGAPRTDTALVPEAEPAGAVRRTRASAGTRAAQTPVTVARAGRERPSATSVYDTEIAALQAVLKQRRAQLDPKTVAALEQSMQVIDGAIEHARAALAADPASRFLDSQLNIALGKKMELLRIAATLPSA